MRMLPSTLFVWGDQFKAELLATCRVEVYSRPVIYTKARIGMKTQHSLALPALAARTISVYSNKPNEVYQTNIQYGEPMRLIPNSLNHINVHIECKERQDQASPTLVNCVDTHTGELVYSWLLIIETVV